MSAMTKEQEDFQESEYFQPENMLMDELQPEYVPEDSEGFQPEKPPEIEPTPTATSESVGEVDETPVIEPEKLPEMEEIRKRLEKAEETAKKAEARAGYWQRQAVKEKAPPQEETPPVVTDIPAPKEEDFDTERDFLIALADHRADIKIREWDAKSRAQNATSTEQQAHEMFKDRLRKEGHEMFSDFTEAISDITIPITDGILQTLKETEVPVEITYYLAKNAKECAAISRMTPMAAAVAIGKIEAKIIADKEQLKEPGNELPEEPPKPKPVTKAPPPITPIRSQSAPVTKDPSKMTNDEYRLYRRAGGK